MNRARPGGRPPAVRDDARVHVRTEDFESPFHQPPGDRGVPGKTWTAAVAVPASEWPSWTDAPFLRACLALSVETGGRP